MYYRQAGSSIIISSISRHIVYCLRVNDIKMFFMLVLSVSYTGPMDQDDHTDYTAQRQSIHSELSCLLALIGLMRVSVKLLSFTARSYYFCVLCFSCFFHISTDSPYFRRFDDKRQDGRPASKKFCSNNS